MTTKTLREYVKKHLLPFVQVYKQGFYLDVCSEGFSFIYEDKDLILLIDFRLFKGSYIHTNAIGITLKEVEHKMTDLLEKNEFKIERQYRTLRTIPQHSSEEALSLKRLGKSIRILKEEDFIERSDNLKIYLSQLVFPFFDKYSSIEGVSVALNEMTVRQMLTYLGGDYPIQFYKAMYISYHAGDFKRYEEIKTGLCTSFEEANQMVDYVDKVPLYEKVYQKLIELLEGR